MSLSPTATEMLFAIDAGDQVEAVDDQSNYPSDAPMTDLSGFEPNVEAIVSYEPDLVVYATEPGDLGASLDRLGIPALQQHAAITLDDVYDQIEQLGVATGNEPEAEAVVETMRDEIESITASIEPPSEPLTYYHELDDTYYSVTSSTFIGQLYSLVGLENIADEAKGAGGGYPQLSAEYIVDCRPRPDLPRRHEVLRPIAADRGEAPRMGSDRRGGERWRDPAGRRRGVAMGSPGRRLPAPDRDSGDGRRRRRTRREPADALRSRSAWPCSSRPSWWVCSSGRCTSPPMPRSGG